MALLEDTARVRAAMDRVKAWMLAHGADVLVHNLADGATPERLAQYEAAVGFALPPGLRALWRVHAGQHDEQNGFVGHLDLLGPVTPCAEQEDVATWIRYLREDSGTWAEAGVRDEEVASDHWIAVASRGYADLVVVSGVTGRVFTCEKDVPPLHLVAPSVVDWLEDYADRVENGAYVVEEGFGDCYLESV